MGKRRDRLFVLFVCFLVAAVTAAWSDESLLRRSDDRASQRNGRGSDTKVTLCHVPPGNAAYARTIVVAQAAAPAHLAHGDSLGACPPGCQPSVPSPVPKTGQTTCWDEDGNSIDCAGTGQDGEYQKGVSVSPRFTDNGNGTVTDNLTGLFWSKDAGCLEDSWSGALVDANMLSAPGCGLTDGSMAGDWRLPNIKELQSLIDYGQFGPPLPPGHPFSRVQSASDYWSSTTFADFPSEAHVVTFGLGYLTVDYKDAASVHMWPVRGGVTGPPVTPCQRPPGNPENAFTIAVGQPAVAAHLARRDSSPERPPARQPAFPSPVPKTGQTTCWDQAGNEIDCTGTGQDGEYEKGVSASPRFTDNDDGTVTDNLTGLIWLKDAGCLGSMEWNAALTAANMLSAPACGLTDGSVAGDWRLPNVKEIQSLFDYGQFNPSLPPGHPFVGVQSMLYWSSTTNPSYPVTAWHGDGGIATKRSHDDPVWPVRGGQ